VLAPNEVVLPLPRAGESRFTTFDVQLRLERGVGAGDVLTVSQGYLRGNELLGDDVVRHRVPDWQTEDRQGENFLSITGSPHPIALGRVRGAEGTSVALEFREPLAAGTTLQFRFGDRAFGSPGQRIPPYPLEELILFSLRRSGRVERATVPLAIRATQVDRLLVVVPATPSARTFPIAIRAMQGGGATEDAEALVETATGEVALAAGDGVDIVPRTVTLVQGRWNGSVSVAADRGRVRATLASASGTSGESNPFQVTPSGDRLFFGSMHDHSAVGGHAAGTSEQAFVYARDVTCLDFFALTEHAGAPHFHWRELRTLPDRYLVPNRFVTFAGYEWSQADTGHRHVILREGKNSVAFCPGGADEIDERDATTLAAFLGPGGPGSDPNALVVCHHTGLRTHESADAYAWGEAEPAPRQTLLEVFSWHGSSLQPDPLSPLDGRADHTLPGGRGSYVLEALRSGKVFGLVADGDQHFARPGSPIGVQRVAGQRLARHGLTAVWAPSLTRDAIFAALENHRCYGTTGPRILLDFRAGERPMGSVLPPAPIELGLEVHGTAPLARVTLLGQAPEPVAVFTPQSDSFATTITVEPAADRESFYLVWVQQSDAHEAFSSPIYFRPSR
jgi:hypothetical protein